MKRILVALILMFFLANVAYAAKSPNGVPFVNLQEQVDDLYERIDSCGPCQGLGELEERLDNLTYRVDSFFDVFVTYEHFNAQVDSFFDIFVGIDAFEEKIAELEDNMCFGSCRGEFSPVCGEDGTTYVNPCAAGCAGIEVAYGGQCAACIPSEEICDGIDNNCDNLIDEGDACSGIVTCCLTYSGECFTSTIDECVLQDGAIQECAPVAVSGDPPLPGELKNYTQTDPAGNQSGWVVNLTSDITSTGVTNRTEHPYVPGTHDCDDFADELERNLTALGYDATFTYYWCKRPDGTYYGHAVTDVHAPDGTMVWVEPQNGRVVNLDFDGDGTAEARTHHVHNAEAFTDDSCAIEVYDNMQAAVDAGAVMD